jgi:hypothetical protein
MKVTDYQLLSARQQHAMKVAMVVRNALENFHVAYLSDPQMKDLNQLVRYAIDDGYVPHRGGRRRSRGSTLLRVDDRLDP